jgi:transposase
MTEKPTELSKRLVVGHKRDGRSCYDKEAKRELIEACLQPGVSIARMGLQHGINANLLRTWITRYRRQRELMLARPAAELAAPAVASAFVPVVRRRRGAVSECVRCAAPAGSNWT